MTDLVKYEEAPLATVLGVQPQTMMTYAIKIADTLTEVLRQRNMTQKFGNSSQEHVKSEGWQLAGSLMGFTASEGPAKELDDGSFEAVMELRSVASGKVLAVASARCGTDEPNWRAKPKFARRSMAYTRALGRVYCQNFRWLIHLAGFSGTPAEEMEGLEIERPEAKREVTRQEPAKPLPESYDSKKPTHQRQLKAILEKRNVPEDLWEQVSDGMEGKFQEALDDVIADVFAKVSEI